MLKNLIVSLLVTFGWQSFVFASGEHDHHAIPTMPSRAATSITIENNVVALTFGPVDLPSTHDGDLAASMPKHIFQLPRDMYMTGFKSEMPNKTVCLSDESLAECTGTVSWPFLPEAE